ncbi:MAG: bifunctional methylenetetrahydrofolate dehydrogenase/methenyltetrahydrofolate cyclohydrolase FolD [Sulfurospirillum sp.]|nr:bifunctional methylenetetrahydrofolate dehydrogenase/methenyltetrahydrofolate cyclohydrolase FolD [Sulfurospirillum sp.]
MQILDGKALSIKIKEKLKDEITTLKKDGITPGLAVILVGEDPASQTYVNAKDRASQEVGIYSKKITLPPDTTQEALLQQIADLNADNSIHGILVQLPLPKHIDTAKVIEAIAPHKDVDGFHELNVGKLSTGSAKLIPCTPLGVMEILKEYNIDPMGLDACVLGRSNIVGKPMMNLLLNAGATVTICHSKTKNLKEKTSRADLIVVGIGKPEMLQADMIKEGAIIIDVGINRLESGKLVGDVAFTSVAPKCSYITPVPGGVGPMTIAMLLQNTLIAAKNKG